MSVLNEIGAMVFNNINKIREKIKVERRVSKNAKKEETLAHKEVKIDKFTTKWNENDEKQRLD